ncbi:MAG: serine/threonine protein kinase [Myxococcota bacterium]|nr:serine/threonine protein kinase [Myxococcota bacterium]
MGHLKKGYILRNSEGQMVEVIHMIAAGGQGEVYKVRIGSKHYALKWYFPPTNPQQQEQAGEQLVSLREFLLQNSPPDSRFLWPLSMIMDKKKNSFGYIMELLEPRFQGLEKLVLGRMRPIPKFNILCKAAINLAESFRKLHNMGACYKDINLGGPFLDPNTGDIRICDTDNVRINKTPGNIIFIFFAAPELIRNEGICQTNTDIHSLAVLLFYMFVRHHPLDGKRELKINVFNEIAQREFYGKNPIFIYDPQNDSNRPVPGFHDAAIRNWKLYPSFLKRLFTRAFTDGLHEPNKRVREGEWMEAFSKLRDCLYYCSECGSENFYDFEREDQGEHQVCWRCNQKSRLPMRLDIGDRKIFLNYNSALYPHHLGKRLDFSRTIAEVNQHPQNPRKWGLKNLSVSTWSFTGKNGTVINVEKERSLPLRTGLEVNFGAVQGKLISR